METADKEFASSAAAAPGKAKDRDKFKHFDPGPVVRETGVPGVRMDFNTGLRLSLPENGNYHLRVTDQDTETVLLDADVKGPFLGMKKRYYINYLVELWRDGEKLLTHHLSLAGKNVRLCF